MPKEDTFHSKIDYYRTNYNDALIQKACDVLSSLDIPSLYAQGMQRRHIQYEIFNQYPPYFLLSGISEKEVFSRPCFPFSFNNEKKKSIALYLHLPFCLEKCSFCRYFSMTDWKPANIDIYLKYLEREMTIVSQKPYMRGRDISSLYWGGVERQWC